MARYRKFLDTDVLTAAKQRIEKILDTHDTLVVLFSGGKDSLVVLHLALEAVKRRGQKQLDVVFWDEELIPNCVIDFVKSYYDRPDINMVWLCLPMLGKRYTIGTTSSYIQWDPKRKWVREMPSWATTDKDVGDGRTVYHQKSINGIITSMYRGRVAMLNGIRAVESLMRYRGVVRTLVDTAICPSTCPTASFCRPIYDWNEVDVFKYFYDNEIQYCELYDSQVLCGVNLRVATPLNRGARVMERMREMDPDFYDRIMEAFPEARLNRYDSDIDRDSAYEKYGRTYLGVKKWVEENLDEQNKGIALYYYRYALARLKNRPTAHHPAQLLHWMMNGTFHNKPPQLRDHEYEQWKERYP